MRLRLGLLGLLVAIASPAASSEMMPPVLAPLPQQGEAANLSAQFLSRYAYKPVALDDALSAKIFDRFLKSLDPDRSFFLQAHIEGFMGDSLNIDDAIATEDLTVPFEIFNGYSRQVVDRMTFARGLLDKGFDFTVKEEYPLLRDKGPWPASQQQSDDIWRKRVKNDWLRLKLAGQKDPAIRQTLDKRYQNIIQRVRTYKSEDVFQTFMTAYTASVDPHTDYFGAAASADFDISMKLSLVGIGAVLQDRDGYTTIRELVPGGPAQLSGKLAVGDRIIGVGQGDKGTLQEVVGTRLDEVVRLIRGEKDTVVRLDILPASGGEGGSHRVITLLRDKINLEKQAAKKTVISVQESGATRKIGVITLPAFYEDFEARRKGAKDYRSASRDVAKLLEDLKNEDVDGVVMDLRNNGGGSLAEAIDLTGLFVGKGPVVQQRSADGKVEIDSDDLAKPAWAGPVSVLINRGSASASEIFAAAIQDYGRGVVIGEPSFGKGTVQTVVDLDQAVRSDKPKFGQLKLTIAQFFRIDGGTTQLRGVAPDISLPGLADIEAFGESSYDNALPWTEIKPARYKVKGDVAKLLPDLQARHMQRVKTDRDFQAFLENVAELKAKRNQPSISLNEAERRAEIARARVAGGEDDGLNANERSLGADLAMEDVLKNEDDVLRNEAAAITADQAALSKTIR